VEQKDNFHILVLGIDIATAFDTVVSTIRSSPDISNVTITYNGHNGVSVDLHSTLYIQGSSNTVFNNYHGIWLRNGSAVILSSQAVSITNNSTWGVLCAGMESSLAGNTSGVTANTAGQVNCTGF
jgi:hypothetical protein